MYETIIYMYWESEFGNHLIMVEDKVKDYWEAVHHCKLYSKQHQKHQKDFLFYSHGKWFIYDPYDEIGVEVA